MHIHAKLLSSLKHFLCGVVGNNSTFYCGQSRLTKIELVRPGGDGIGSRAPADGERGGAYHGGDFDHPKVPLLIQSIETLT